jgi:hypothetical protein
MLLSDRLYRRRSPRHRRRAELTLRVRARYSWLPSLRLCVDRAGGVAWQSGGIAPDGKSAGKSAAGTGRCDYVAFYVVRFVRPRRRSPVKLWRMVFRFAGASSRNHRPHLSAFGRGLAKCAPPEIC